MTRMKYREVWRSALLCIACSVGLGNLWRFPYIAYREHGGSFLVAYIICLIAVAIPMQLLEMTLAQTTGGGPGKSLSASVLTKGVGFSMILLSVISLLYCNFITSVSLVYFCFYLYTVPGQYCPEEWNITNCYLAGDNISDDDVNGTHFQLGSYHFWTIEIFNRTEGIYSLGLPRWHLVISSLVTWIFICYLIIQGLKFINKAVYFTAFIPYILLVATLITAAILPHSYKGIQYLLVPSLEGLSTFSIWRAAVGQLFFSMSITFGGLFIYGSYNPFRYNVYRDAIIISTLTALVSVLTGCTATAFLGYLTKTNYLAIEEVADRTPNLSVIIYNEIFLHLPFPNIWGCTFFLVIYIIGIDYQFGMVQLITESLIELFPYFVEHKFKFLIAITVVHFFLEIPFLTQGGEYVFTVIDVFGIEYASNLIAFFEVSSIFWILGFLHFSDDLQRIFGISLNIYWRITWLLITPTSLVIIFLSTVIMFDGLKYGKYSFPSYVNIIGWLIVTIVFLPIPIFAIYGIVTQNVPGISAKIKSAAGIRTDWEREELKKISPNSTRLIFERDNVASMVDINLNTLDQ